MYKVKEVADMAGISVRMLHHYDQIGLFKPNSVSSNGYRLYSNKDLERLQQILFFKELDFSLQDIGKIIDSPSFDKKQALVEHKQLLQKKLKRLERIIQTVERTIHLDEGGMVMDNKEMFKGFDMAEIERHKQKYAEEVKQKYGNSDAYKESERRTSSYTKSDWEEIMAKGDNIYKRIVSLMDKGPASPEVQQVVDEYRQYITNSFYNCTPEIFRGLGDLYVTDERFTKNIDKYQDGLSIFLKEAMHFYYDNLEK